ncbi:HAMP domain-containing sensor histidine kinase [Shimia ponticola]|uniref:HAMP domain-containing sensor histidine kinase n=1 Tax=Shimia ponticola TaxID=2582893 RepID=UPI0011BF8F8A|nr:HAMP domain-containing sensor histidine kinase [Shimia ponticola]
MTRTRVLASNIFRRTVAASMGYIAVAVGLVWLIGFIAILQIEGEEWARIEAEIAETEDAFQEGGIEAALDLHRIGDAAEWDDDVILARLEEEQIVVAIRNFDDDVLVGYPGLWPDDAAELVYLDHPTLDEGLRAEAFGLGDEAWGTIALFVPEREYYWGWLMPQMTYALILVGLPLSLIIGFLLSRGVLARIEAISDTAGAVVSGRMQSRVELQGTGDEFDRLSSEINGMLDKLAQLNRNIEAVSVGVAHDLKTPLANVAGRLDLIRRDLNDSDAAHAHIEKAERYLDGLLRVFDALLRLGEVETGRRRAGFGQVDVSTLAQDMADSFAPLFDDAQKSLDVRVAKGVATTGDRELLQQLLSNLLENAIEHSRDAARVFVELEQARDAVVLRVGDDGPGVSPIDRARLFDRFHRGDQSRNTPGNGLGLSLVKAIAELHGGDVTLLEGTTGAVFEVKIPA